MGFDIPMNTKGAMDASSLLSLNGGTQGNAGLSPNGNIGMPQQGQNNYGSMQPQNNYNGQNNYGSMQPQNNYGCMQSQNNYGSMQGQNNYNGQNNYGGMQGQNNAGMQPQNNYGSMQSQNNYGSMQGQNNAGMQNNNVMQPKQRPQGGGVHLKKGQKFAIAGAGGAQLSTIRMGLGWDIKNQACDLDASVFMLDGNSRILNGDDSWFVFYGQTVSPDGSVKHSGDSQGRETGDDETITINLSQVNPQVQRIAFVVTIDEALDRGLNFSMVANAYVRIIDGNTGSELARFNLTDYYANVTAMVVGELYRHNGSWKFNPVGDGVAKDLAGLCEFYGVRVAD